LTWLCSPQFTSKTSPRQRAAANQAWALYWRDRNLRFHAYDLPPSRAVDDLLAEINRDPTGIFWG
jgi:Protein of unknown function (DUF3024)